MKFILFILCAAFSRVALAQLPTSSASPVPCSDVKDASNPARVILVCETATGSLAEAKAKYPALKAKLDAAAAKLAKDKEPLLLKLLEPGPNQNVVRALSKMNEFLAAGVPISKATQDKIVAAVPEQSRPRPSPSPPPDDGL